jgi:hypothetical protein
MLQVAMVLERAATRVPGMRDADDAGEDAADGLR